MEYHKTLQSHFRLIKCIDNMLHEKKIFKSYDNFISNSVYQYKKRSIDLITL